MEITVMSTFIYDERNLQIQGFYTSADPSKIKLSKKLKVTAGERDIYGNGKMTGICFVKYTYKADDVTFDSSIAGEIEDNIKSKIKFLDHAQSTDVTTKGWQRFTSDEGGRNDQYYHDYSTPVDKTVPTPVITTGQVSNTLLFFLLPPTQKSGGVTTTIYAFYPPDDSTNQDPTKPSNPYSTYNTCTINFNVNTPTADKVDFTMSDKYVSGSGYHDCTHIYYIDYSSEKKAAQVVPAILQWDFDIKYPADQDSGKMVNMGYPGGSRVISLFTQGGSSGLADVTILALNASDSALWPSDTKYEYPPHGSPYDSAEPLDDISGYYPTTSNWQTVGMSRLFDSGFNPSGIPGVPMVSIFGGHFNSDGDDGCTDSDYRYNHLYAIDCFGTTLEITIDNDSTDYWNHEQAISSVTVY